MFVLTSKNTILSVHIQTFLKYSLVATQINEVLIPMSTTKVSHHM